MRIRYSHSLVLISCLFLVTPNWLYSRTPTFDSRSKDSTKAFTGLPTEAQFRMSAIIGSKVSAYNYVLGSGGPHLSNEAQNLSADFSSRGLALKVEAAFLTISFQGYGYGDHLEKGGTPSCSAKSNRIEYRRGSLTEWYVNGPMGLEQGFTVDRRPKWSNGAPLIIAMRVTGAPLPVIGRDADTLTFQNKAGKVELRYSGLKAYDANGKELKASFALTTRFLTIRVEDKTAKYPVVVDPVFQRAELTASNGQENDSLGTSVSISGNTIVAGAPRGDGSSNGSAYVFVKPSEGWQNMTETAQLTASDSALGDLFGDSVSIDGDTIVVGAPDATVGSNIGQGAAYVFVRPPNGWSDMTQTAKLTSSDGAVYDQLGSSVSLQANTVAAGAVNNLQSGSVYVFQKPSIGWLDMTQTAKLTPSDGKNFDLFGMSVAISPEGTIAIVGSPNAGVSAAGGAYLYIKGSLGWSNMTEAAKLTASDGMTGDYLGVHVASSFNGSTLAVGAFSTIGANSEQGAVYIFTEPSGGWVSTTQTAKLTASDGRISDQLGDAIAISPAGNAVIAGAPSATAGDTLYQGAAYFFLKPKSGWANGTQTAKLVTSQGGAGAGDGFGSSIMLSGDVIVISSPGWPDFQGLGTVYVFEK